MDRKLYFPLTADCLQRCDDFTLVIAISVDWKLYSSIVYRLSPEMWWWIIALDWNYMPRYSKWIQLVDICLPIVSRDMMISLWSSFWKTMMYMSIHRGSHLSPKWNHSGNHGLPWCTPWIENYILPLSTDCLQRCDDELLHSLKKSDSCIPWCTPWIEIIYHDIQSEYNW